MIYFLATRGNSGPITRYLEEWGGPLRQHLRWVAYEDLRDADSLADAAACIFGDVERLSAETTRFASELWAALAARSPEIRLLDHPGRVLRRYELLRTLHDRGWNRFNVHRLDEPRGAVRFPVFVRHACEHEGAYTPLLADAAGLERAGADLAAAGHRVEDLLIVEYVDTVDAGGFYRKYSATRIGDRLIAHHLMFAREWEVKGPSLVSSRMVAAERDYQRGNPHAERLREVFHAANIDYGRIDYALLEGEVQVWEINTNPTLLYPRERYERSQRPAKRWFSRQLNQSLWSLDRAAEPVEPRSLLDRLAAALGVRTGRGSRG